MYCSTGLELTLPLYQNKLRKEKHACDWFLYFIKFNCVKIGKLTGGNKMVVIQIMIIIITHGSVSVNTHSPQDR